MPCQHGTYTMSSLRGNNALSGKDGGTGGSLESLKQTRAPSSQDSSKAGAADVDTTPHMRAGSNYLWLEETKADEYSNTTTYG